MKDTVKIKTEKATGRWAWIEGPTHKIVINKIECGSIREANRKTSDLWQESKVRIVLSVKKNDVHNDGNPNCSWMWIRLAKKFDSVEEAKEFLERSVKEIAERYSLVDPEKE